MIIELIKKNALFLLFIDTCRLLACRGSSYLGLVPCPVLACASHDQTRMRVAVLSHGAQAQRHEASKLQQLNSKRAQQAPTQKHRAPRPRLRTSRAFAVDGSMRSGDAPCTEAGVDTSTRSASLSLCAGLLKIIRYQRLSIFTMHHVTVEHSFENVCHDALYACAASLPPPSVASSSTKKLVLARPSRFESMGVAVPKVEVERERTASFSNADVEAVSNAELSSVRASHSQGSTSHA